MNEGVGSVSSISVESKENAKTERQAMIARIGTARKYALVEGILIDRVTMRVAVKGPKRTPFVKFNLLSFPSPFFLSSRSNQKEPCTYPRTLGIRQSDPLPLFALFSLSLLFPLLSRL